jgi:hypothetical protein
MFQGDEMTDYNTHDGAAQHARSIMTFWLAKGYFVETRLEIVSGGRDGHTTWTVKTNMVNGLPKDYARRNRNLPQFIKKTANAARAATPQVPR